MTDESETPQSSSIDHEADPDHFRPRYDLSPDELAAVEHDMVEQARLIADNDMVAAWISPKHPYSNFLRTMEAQKFPEVAGVEDYYENHQKYLALIDTRENSRVVHAATIMEFDDQHDEDSLEATRQRTGFYTVDSLIGLGNFSRNDFVDYYEKRGIFLPACISVETNFKFYERTELYDGLATADLVYLTLFNMFIDRDVPKDGTLLFATVNRQQEKSLSRNGIEFEPLMGRTDFDTEEADLGKVSSPIAISFMSGYNLLAPLNFRLPEVRFEPEPSQTS